jgi:hypothetical protein
MLVVSSDYYALAHNSFLFLVSSNIASLWLRGTRRTPNIYTGLWRNDLSDVAGTVRSMVSLVFNTRLRNFQPGVLSSPCSLAYMAHEIGSSLPMNANGSYVVSPFPHSTYTLYWEPLYPGSPFRSGP